MTASAPSLLAILLPGLLAVSCTRGATQNGGVDGAPEPTVEARLSLAACSSPDCKVQRIVAVGADASGMPMAIAITLTSDAAATRCQERESWLLAAPAGAPARRVRLLGKGIRCTESDDPVVDAEAGGAVRYVEPRLERLTWDQQGPGSTAQLRVSNTYDLHLDPLSATHVLERRSAWPSGLRALLGEGPADPSVPCQLDRSPDSTSPPWKDACDSSVTLPWVQVDGDFGAGGWRNVALDDCALSIDGLHGRPEPAGSGSASLRALMTDDALYVEVSDDVFVTQGVKVDTFSMHLTAGGGKPDGVVWVMTMDGAVKSYNAMSGPDRWSRAEVAMVDAHTRRFRLKSSWKDWVIDAAIAYSDTDDGRSVKQVLRATAGDDGIVGFDPKVARCVPEGGVLRVRRADAFGADAGDLPLLR